MDSNDVVNVIIQTINTIFSNLFSSIDNSMYDSLDNYVFIDSSVLNNNVFKNLLGFNGNGFLYLTDAMLIGVALFYIVRFYFLILLMQMLKDLGNLYLSYLFLQFVLIVRTF